MPWEEPPPAVPEVVDVEPEEIEDHAELEEDVLPAPVEVVEEEDTHSPDDALGLYLRQMGAIPLLDRKQELALAERLERRRRHYRTTALLNWRTLKKVVQTFELVLAGKLALDPTIDVVKTLGRTRENILATMPTNLKTLNKLLTTSEADFRNLERASSATAQRAFAAICGAGCARPFAWLKRCRRAWICWTVGATRWSSSGGRWRNWKNRRKAATVPPPTGNGAPSWPNSCANYGPRCGRRRNI